MRADRRQRLMRRHGSAVGALPLRAHCERYMVHFMRSVPAEERPPTERPLDGAALKAIFTMKSRESTLTRTTMIAAEMESEELSRAAKWLKEGIDETTTCLPDDHRAGPRRRHIRTNTMIERPDRELRLGTRVAGVDACRRRDPPSPASSGPTDAARTCPGQATHTGGERDTAPMTSKAKVHKTPGTTRRQRYSMSEHRRNYIHRDICDDKTAESSRKTRIQPNKLICPYCSKRPISRSL